MVAHTCLFILVLASRGPGEAGDSVLDLWGPFLSHELGKSPALPHLQVAAIAASHPGGPL
jgi:hypothetical protein